jgi:RNA polymerase sigma-70 factor (ECF subfamily)
MTTESDRLLIQQARQGDEDAWQQLIERYQGRLLAYVERRLQDISSAEDIVQETFIGFLNSLPNFDERRDVQTYLFTIAAHKLIDHLRRIGRHPIQNMPDVQDYLEKIVDRQRGCSSIVRFQERQALERDAMVRGLQTLIHTWRDRGEYLRLKVVELLFVKGWPNKEVAAFLGIEEQLVANIRFAAVRKLIEFMRNAALSPDVFPELQTPLTP